MFRVASLLGRMASLSLGGSAPSAVASATVPQIQSVRSKAGFMVRIRAEDLWRSVTSVSNPGRKRGRASGANKKTAKDLNRGQVRWIEWN